MKKVFIGQAEVHVPFVQRAEKGPYLSQKAEGRDGETGGEEGAEVTLVQSKWWGENNFSCVISRPRTVRLGMRSRATVSGLGTGVQRHTAKHEVAYLAYPRLT